MTPPRLTRLTARGFRNLEPLDWTPGPGRHLLLGDNGAGKTSVLESVYVLATTKSFRTSRLAECVHHGESALALAGDTEGDRRTRLAVAWSESGGLERSVDGSTTDLAGHLEVLPVVAWTSDEVETVVGAPSLRRRLLDRGAVGVRPAVLEVRTRHRRALAQKRQLLSREPAPRPSELAPWNDLLATAAAELITARARYAESLAEALGAVLDASGLDFPEIVLRYKPSPRKGLDGVDAVRGVLERVADRELARGYPLVGPHRDDLEIAWGGHPVGSVASAGERKALSLLLSAAQGRVLEAADRRPVYLLDDLDAELARNNLERLWGVFPTTGQVLATSNRPGVWKGLESDFRWSLSGGRLESA